MGGQNGSLNHMSANKPQGSSPFTLGKGCLVFMQTNTYVYFFPPCLLIGYNMGNTNPYPNGNSSHNTLGLGASGMNDPASSMKEWQDGLRALFPNVNISMNNGGVNNSNSRMSAFPPGLSGMSNGHQQQPPPPPPQHHHHHLQHQLPPAPQSNTMAYKGWRNSVSDWTSLDPAIVSSGQITESRSDSPPHWLRSLEQLTETGNSPASQPPSNPSNLFGLANNPTHFSLPSMAGRSNVTSTPGLDGLNSMGSFWPSHAAPSMPPPGFSHIRPSPKTAATADTHKIDSKSSQLHQLILSSF